MAQLGIKECTSWILKSLSDAEAEQLYCPKCSLPMVDRFRMEPCAHICCFECASATDVALEEPDYPVPGYKPRKCALCHAPIRFVSVLPEYPTPTTATSSTSFVAPNGSVVVMRKLPDSVLNGAVDVPNKLSSDFGLQTVPMAAPGLCLCCPVESCFEPHFKWFSTLDGLLQHLEHDHSELVKHDPTLMSRTYLELNAKPLVFKTMNKLNNPAGQQVGGVDLNQPDADMPMDEHVDDNLCKGAPIGNSSEAVCSQRPPGNPLIAK